MPIKERKESDKNVSKPVMIPNAKEQVNKARV